VRKASLCTQSSPDLFGAYYPQVYMTSVIHHNRLNLWRSLIVQMLVRKAGQFSVKSWASQSSGAISLNSSAKNFGLNPNANALLLSNETSGGLGAIKSISS